MKDSQQSPPLHQQGSNQHGSNQTGSMDITTFGPSEFAKRRREVFAVFFLLLLFLGLTWFEIRLFGISQTLPVVHSIFFFGLVNFNIVLLLILFFLVFRNIVKVFVEKKGKVIGSSLRAKLVAAFVTFSVVPTVLMFLVSVFYINSSFDKWFSVKMVGVLKSSLEVTNAYYFNAKKKNYHFAHLIAQSISELQDEKRIRARLKELRSSFSLDAVEFYPSLFAKRELVVSDDESIPEIPTVSLEFLNKGIKSQSEASTIHQFGEGNLVRVIVPVKHERGEGAVVVSSFVPLSLITKMNDISAAYEDFRDINPLAYPLKSIYLTILVLMTLVILLSATWFGFHLSKQLAIPLVMLANATKRVTGGDYAAVDIPSGSEEISQLVDNFNIMTHHIFHSEREVKEANQNLNQTLSHLDKHSRYLEIVLGNVSTGVISVDNLGIVTTINRHACKLLKIEPEKYINKPVRKLLTREHFYTFANLVKTMQEHKVEIMQKEFRLGVGGEAIPVQMTISILKNEQGDEMGRVFVFDDLTMLVNSQRAAAWTEVARRIAHEIKNPLTPIKLSAERLQRKFGSQISDNAFLECTTMIIKQTDDLKNLVNEFSQFARLPQAKPVIGSLNTVIEESMVLYRNAHVDKKFALVLDAHLPDFKFDPNQMKRVLVNLLDNAVAAVAHVVEGTVSIETHFEQETKIVRLTVTDNGLGIPASQRSRIFEPYYSTKEGGTGLGLPIVKRIIEDHNGFIRALSNDGKGTKMVIEIPIQEGKH